MYLVTCGDYDDYRVHSVWSTQENADEAVRILMELGIEYSAQVEVYEVDAFTFPDVPKGETPWRVDKQYVNRLPYAWSAYRDVSTYEYARNNRADITELGWAVWVLAKDKEQAIERAEAVIADRQDEVEAALYAREQRQIAFLTGEIDEL